MSCGYCRDDVHNPRCPCHGSIDPFFKPVVILGRLVITKAEPAGSESHVEERN